MGADDKIETKVDVVQVDTRETLADDSGSDVSHHHLTVAAQTEDGQRINLGWHTWVVMIVTTIALISQVFASAAAGGHIAFIVRDLGDQALSGWLIQAPLLMQCILSPVIGRFSDIMDRKWVVTIPPFFGFVGSFIAAKAPNMTTLIGGCLLIGATLPTAAVVHAIQAEILPKRLRAIASASAFVGAGLGGFGAGLGGSYLTSLSVGGWRYIFWIQSAFHGAAFVGFLFFYWPSRRSDYPKMNVKEWLWLCDPIGSFLFITGSTLTLIPLNWAGGKYQWHDPRVYGMLTVGVITLIAFLLYEWKGRTDGLVPHVVFHNGPNFPIAWFMLSIEGWIMYGALMQLNHQIIINLGFENNAWNASLRGLSFMVPGLIFTVVISIYATRFKDMIGPLFVTWPIFMASVVCFATLAPSQGLRQVIYSILGGLGQSGPMALLVPLIQFAAPHAYLSTASGIAYSGRSIGGAFGTAITAYVSNRYIFSHFDSQVGAAALGAGLPEDSVPDLLRALKARIVHDALEHVPGLNSTILEITMHESHWVYAKAYRQAWWSILPLVIICMISLFFLRNVKELMTDKVEATVERVQEKKEGDA